MNEPVVSVSRTIAASAADLWTLISDLPRMGEWSPENTGGDWIKGATGPAIGARFKGKNANGKKTWSTIVVVSECEPGRSFGFHVVAGPLKVAHWHYALASIGEAGAAVTEVTETWTDERSALVTWLGKPISGVADRAAHNRAGMEETLRRLDEFVSASGVA